MKPLTECRTCPLFNAEGPVWGDGPPDAKLVIIGQSPGPQEADTGIPFIGPSGLMLNRELYTAGILREKCYVTNAVKCEVPTHHEVPWQARVKCAPLLLRELSNLDQKKVILTVGGVAFTTLTGKTLSTVTSRTEPNKWLRGAPYYLDGTSPFDYASPRVIIPTIHPSYVMTTGFRELPFLQADVQKAVSMLNGWEVIPEDFDYEPTDDVVTDVVKECINQGKFGLDIETPETALENEEELFAHVPTEIQVVGISPTPGRVVGVLPHQFELLRPLFEGPNHTTLIGFNLAFDVYAHLIRRFPNWTPALFDLMLALNCLYSDARPKDLGMALSLFTHMPFHKNLAKIDPSRYQGMDTYGPLLAHAKVVSLLETYSSTSVFNSAMRLLPIVYDMYFHGANCDVSKLLEIELFCQSALEQYIDIWGQLYPTVSWSSPKQLLELFKGKGLPPILRKRNKDASGNRKSTPSTDDEVLEIYRNKYGFETAALILQMRQLKKAADFTHIFHSDGRAHAVYKIHGQKQGRLQAKDPDLQNIPEVLLNSPTFEGIHPREGIIPDNPDRILITADYSQIEFWLYAWLSQDPILLQAKAQGEYIYGVFYETMFKEPFFQEGQPRKKAFMRPEIPPAKLLRAKAGPLGMIYGRSAKSLAEEFGISLKDAKGIHFNFFGKHPGFASLHEQLTSFVKRHGFLRNAFGRIRRFPHAEIHRQEMFSFPGQSNAADILINYTLIPLAITLPDFGARLVLTVHDSIGISCPKQNAKACAVHIKETMETPVAELGGFFTTVSVKAGPNWYKQESI